MLEESIRQALSKLSYGIYVITARRGEAVNGVTASWVTQVSFSPPMLLAALRPERDSARMIEAGEHFAINVLSNEQRDFALRFASGEKFDGLPMRYLASGVPELPNALAVLECELEKTFPAGDHELFLGRLVFAKAREQGYPLLLMDFERDYTGV
jgi:flavin reductase (DIM6/NTAB) family NADH-FMN oxidoreductase RutF